MKTALISSPSPEKKARIDIYTYYLAYNTKVKIRINILRYLIFNFAKSMNKGCDSLSRQ